MATRKLVLPKDRVQMLAFLTQHYNFTPAINAHLKTLQTNPMVDPPEFITRRPLVLEKVPGHQFIKLGHVDGHRVHLSRYSADSGYAERERTELAWGCRVIYSEADARKHWAGNVSRFSHRTRPHATQLIDLVAALCRHHGWPW